MNQNYTEYASAILSKSIAIRTECHSILELLIPRSYIDFKKTDTNAMDSTLTAYFFSLVVIEDALKAFIDNKYKSFDALVGNNSCYLVAYLIFKIAHRIKNCFEFRHSVEKCLNNIKETKARILSETHAFSRKITCEAVDNFLNNFDSVVCSELDFIYLSMCFACTHAKHMNKLNFEEINYEKLIDIYSKTICNTLGKKSVQKLVKHWQKILSRISVQTLQSHAAMSAGFTRLWANYITDNQYIKEDERGRFCAPSLYVAALIYDQLMGIPDAIIGLQVNLIEHPKKYISRFTLYFQVQDNADIKIIEPEEFSSVHPVYLLAGCRYIVDASKISIESIKKEFSSRSLKKMILAHEVTYPQYPKSLQSKNIEPREQELIKEINALKSLPGFSLEDPTDLCFTHIFVDDTLTQSLASYEPPVYLPQINQYENESKTSR